MKRQVISKNEKVTLGKIDGMFWCKEELSEGQLNHHVHIVGASGFGKTVLLSHIVEQRIRQNKGLLFIDLKGDIETVEKFRQYAAESNRLHDLCIFSLTDRKLSTSYNLISEGTATQLRDKIMLSLNWSEEFYKNQSASLLLKLLIILCELRDQKKITLHIGVILDCINDLSKFAIYGNLVPPEDTKLKTLAMEIQNFLENKEYYNSLQGLRTQLESMVLADFGDSITSEGEGINLFEAVSSGKIVLIFLDSRRYGETSKAIGRFILQDLKMVSARIDAEVRKEDRKPFTVIIDEFADLAQEDFIGFLDRARSSKMAVVVAHQEICDLLRISPEFAGRLMGNTSTLYAFLQKRPESAEIIASMAGTKKGWKETLQSEKMWLFDIPSGNKSLREVEEFIIHPNIVKSLRVGKCVCVKKYPEPRAYVVRVNRGP